MPESNPPRRPAGGNRPPGGNRPADARRPPAGTKRPAPTKRPTKRPARLTLGRPKVRIRSAGIVLAIVLTLFAGRLIQLQGVDGPVYAARAAKAENRYVKVELAADRGAITDRSGHILADTVDAYDITADPSMFTRAKAEVTGAPRRAAKLLAPMLGISTKQLTKKLTGTGNYVLLARQQSPQTRKEIRALKQKLAERAGSSGRPGQLAGIFDAPHSKRSYPNGELAASVLGFVNSEDAGGDGLEAGLDRTLSGTSGERSYVQVGGRRVPTAGGHEKSALPGRGVRLTLDRDLQWSAQQAIAAKVKETGAESGTVVAMDIKTGQLLAVATAPGYDPNNFGSTGGASHLGNPAFQEAFEPGSTSKVISMAAVLEEQAAVPDTHVTVPGTLQRADRVFHDDVEHGTWQLTLTGVLAKSSNIGTILATEQLGKTRTKANATLYRYLKRFGIGSPTGIGFPGETRGILARPKDWNASQQYTIPFGQGVAMNAVQATSVFATVANGGMRVAPTLVAGTTGPDGRLTPADPPKQTRAISRQTAKTLAEMMETVVSDDGGTGTYARIAGYRVAGKTGTANRPAKNGRGYRGYTASFIGFAPADKPRIAVSCILQDPKRTGHFGGPLCGPVFKDVTRFALAGLRAEPSGTPAPKLDTDWK